MVSSAVACRLRLGLGMFTNRRWRRLVFFGGCCDKYFVWTAAAHFDGHRLLSLAKLLGAGATSGTTPSGMMVVDDGRVCLE